MATFTCCHAGPHAGQLQPYHSPLGQTYLFVGDTLTRDYHRWISVLVPDSNAELQQSLELYRSLRPDVVLMSTTRGHLSGEGRFTELAGRD